MEHFVGCGRPSGHSDCYCDSSYKLHDQFWRNDNQRSPFKQPRRRAGNVPIAFGATRFRYVWSSYAICQLKYSTASSRRDVVESTTSTSQAPPEPGPSSYLPSYSYDAVLHRAKPQPPSHLTSPRRASTTRATGVFTGVAQPNIAEGNYGDPSDKLFSVYLAQADKLDKEQSESWKGDTEGILVFVCRQILLH